jgi:hypothetical protein
MGAAKLAPAVTVDHHLDRLADRKLAALEAAEMDEEVADLLLRVGHGEGCRSAGDRPGITAMGGSKATITAQAAGNFSVSSTPTRLIFATTPVGSTSPQSVLVITPDGKLQVNGVNLNVPDYVFEDDYQLMPLAELRSFIDQNGHLPGIANAKTVASEGLDLAGSQMGLLQKVEELTLYTLQQEGRLADQEARLATQHDHLESQRALLAAQQERVAQLEALLQQAIEALDTGPH